MTVLRRWHRRVYLIGYYDGGGGRDAHRAYLIVGLVVDILLLLLFLLHHCHFRVRMSKSFWGTRDRRLMVAGHYGT